MGGSTVIVRKINNDPVGRDSTNQSEAQIEENGFNFRTLEKEPVQLDEIKITEPIN